MRKKPVCDIPAIGPDTYITAIGPDTSKITVELTIDEARQLRQLLKAARSFAWKLKDAIEAHEAVEARQRDWPHNL